MLLTDLCAVLPGAVLSRRTAKEEIGVPELIKFLTEPSSLRVDVLYLLDVREAERILPECTAPNGSTVLCAGALPRAVSCRVSINLIALDCGLLELYNAAAEYISEQRRTNDLEVDRLNRRFAAIIEQRIPGDYQVDAVCSSFPKRIHSSYCVICVESADKPGRTVNDVLMRSELASLFSEDNIAIYDSDTIIIHSYDGFTHPPELPLEALGELLRKYDACAGVSNGMRKTAQLRLMYILAKKALESGKALLGASGKNVFFYDDTMLFSIIGMAAAGFQEQYGDDDLILLGSPIVVNIMKHDPKGKRQLLETLFQYIRNGGSTSKTADAMHMHRNTVQNRISIIEEITGGQLTRDGMLQAKLLLTYYAIRYYTTVWNKNMVLSPLIEGQDKIIERPEREHDEDGRSAMQSNSTQT